LEKLNAEEWRDWFEHPGTVEFFKRVREEREEAINHLANGLFSESPGKQNVYIGLISALTKVVNAEYSEER
jgi:hypothetical protein